MRFDLNRNSRGATAIEYATIKTPWIAFRCFQANAFTSKSGVSVWGDLNGDDRPRGAPLSRGTTSYALHFFKVLAL
jgi:hypothetical protein